MPTFSYIALDESGARTRGVCESEDVQSAAATLRDRRLFILQIAPASASSRPNDAEAAGPARTGLLDRISRSIRTNDRVMFLRQMCLMLKSGVPLLHALEVFARQCSRRALAQAVRRVAERIQSGKSLSAAIEQERRLLSPLGVRMIAVGEAIGELDVVLERIATHLDRRAEMRSHLLTSLAYPVLLVIATIGVVAFLVTNVIPKFAHLLSARRAAMPPTTQMLISVTDYLNANGMMLIAATVAGVVAILALSLLRPVRYIMDRGLLAVPVVGRLLTLSFVAHFGRTLAVLLKSGVPILDSLNVVCQSVGNRALAGRVKRAADDVLAGRSLSQGMRGRLVPPLLPELIAVGETSGTLGTVLDDAADFYETRLQRMVKWLAGLFEPLMILIVGGIVGFVYIAFFSVLYQASAGR